MPHRIDIAPESTLDALVATLERVRAPQIVLAFAAAPYPQFATSEALAVVRRVCQEREIQVVLVGGDEALRAVAVVAGFVVASSLDDWDGWPIDARRRAFSWRRGGLPWAHSERGVSGYTGETMAAADARDFPVRALPHTPSADGSGDGLDAEDLPDYVRELLEHDGTYGPRERDSALDERLMRITRPLQDDEEEAVRAAAESYEDGVTSAIRTAHGIGAGTGPLRLLRVLSNPRTPNDDDTSDSSAH